MASATGTCIAPQCRRILNWSNPSISYPLASIAPQGSQPKATGASGAADNALTLNSTADTVVNFYPSTDCN
jgi:hypothetical protein